MVLQRDGELDPEAALSPARRDLHHDPWLVPSSPTLRSLAASIFEEVESKSPRPDTQRGDAKQRRQDIVDNLVANLAVLVTFFPENTRLAVSARNTKLTRYDRKGFSREVMMQLLREMEHLGQVVISGGTRGGLRTTVQPAERLHSAIVRLGSSSAVEQLPGVETVILKAVVGRQRPKVFIDYADTPETAVMRAEMGIINEMLAAADLTFDGKPLPPQFLSRRFQIDRREAPHRFDRVGRLYGGFWQTLPKTERHRLRIDGEEMADVDVAGMFVQLAYLRAGMPLPDGDPYDCGPALPRDAAKLAILTMFNMSGPLTRLPTDLRQIIGADLHAREVSAIVAARHPGIAHLFGTGIGLSLMATESQVMVRALLLLKEKGTAALPLHDGLFVARSRAETARSALKQASLEVLGVELPVKLKAIVQPANDNSPPMIYGKRH